ncbi:hypothetical protein PCL_09680 [Purpureocillium lilacinum]|uniref:Uncharacterized protein n=1 Tax=Purpureocillium lilacinum TaxID=33203 RepID=A0A2U3EDS0_PURLI|nr:hypothetical protein PCL_09680 [Purpureocillium lilacinum]
MMPSGVCFAPVIQTPRMPSPRLTRNLTTTSRPRTPPHALGYPAPSPSRPQPACEPPSDIRLASTQQHRHDYAVAHASHSSQAQQRPRLLAPIIGLKPQPPTYSTYSLWWRGVECRRSGSEIKLDGATHRPPTPGRNASGAAASPSRAGTAGNNCKVAQQLQMWLCSV